MKQKIVFVVVFFKEPISGSEPVKDWIKSLSKKDKRVIGHDLLVLQYNWPLGMPLVKSLGKGLWELRSNLSNRITRIIFVPKKDKIIVLHAFVKKTQKTPSNEIEIAKRRLKEIEY
ncbi:MAG: type II toxin-antitoxin system RelE/ParE family toxin [bacterium]|nr:type II toxin-antitoxin system RelE/ParE family toxin [bacterium]